MNRTDWFRNAVVYNILIDRFAGLKNFNWQKPDFLGGNIKGIIEKLDYIKELGINTIWISPFYETTQYHGYHITNYLKVEPRFGTIKDLKELIRQVHKLEIRIIADFVPNHCSEKHPFFQEAIRNKKSKYYHWFTFKKWPDDYLCFMDIRELPKLNLDIAEARDYIISAAKYWLSLGFDGLRLDHAIGPRHTFWRYFKNDIKKDFPETVLIAEVWAEGFKRSLFKSINIKNKFLRWFFGISQEGIQKEYIDNFDGILDFQFRNIVLSNIAHASGKINIKVVQSKIKKHFSGYPKKFFLPAFLDNHDTNRFLYECGNNKKKIKTAANIQFELNQPVIIYYGTEVGMTHKQSIKYLKNHGDLQARQPMVWKDQDFDLLNFYKDLIKKKTPSFLQS